MKEYIIGIIGFIIGLLAIMVITVFGANYSNSISCANKYEGFGPQYSFWSGCRIMVDGKLTPVDIVREIK